MMGGDDGMHNRQAQPRPGANWIRAAIEALKEMWDVGLGDTGAVVTDGDSDVCIAGGGVDCDCPVYGGMANGVFDDIVECRNQAYFVNLNQGIVVTTRIGKGNVFFATEWGK